MREAVGTRTGSKRESQPRHTIGSGRLRRLGATAQPWQEAGRPRSAGGRRGGGHSAQRRREAGQRRRPGAGGGLRVTSADLAREKKDEMRGVDVGRLTPNPNARNSRSPLVDVVHVEWC